MMASKIMRMNHSERSSLQRSASMETYMVRVYPGSLEQSSEFISVEALKTSTSEEIVKAAVQKLKLGRADDYELAETFCTGGQVCKERRLGPSESPVRIQLMWPRVGAYIALVHRTEYHFFLRKKEPDRQTGSWVEYAEPNPIDNFLTTFLQQSSRKKEYPDLCNLPDLNENTLLDNLERRFHNGNIYTYVGSILIAVNPFKYFPIYNPKYVKMYQNRKLGELPPHIFGIADAAYHTMLQERANQCIVISGESGSGKTESTNLLLHHLSALSQRGYYGGGGIEQTILGAGPVLEAFGNAKTVHNNNSSRFGKFIQVNYKENGLVHGAVVEEYLLEKSRIVSQTENERNYHVFYYLLAGANEIDREAFSLTEPDDYNYLNQSQCYKLEGLDGEEIDEAHEFTRLKQSMEMVGFSMDIQKRIFSVLAAVLHLGNVLFKKKTIHAHHEEVVVSNPEVVKRISSLLKVKESTLLEALTKKKTKAGGEDVVMNYKMQDAIATRDAMAKCLYGALFDWIVLQVNGALLCKRDNKDHQGNSIGVLDIFGFEDFAENHFEQYCINYANEHLHYYFNQHIFKFEQEEYMREGIQWKNVEFIDNTGCLDLFAKKPTGLHYLLDEECNFPGATNETLLAKFHSKHKGNVFYEVPQMKENAFIVCHYAGRVKYQIQDFREKNSDLMRHDIVLLLKNSCLSFVRELVGYDPVAVLRWAILRAFFRAYFAFRQAGKRAREKQDVEVKKDGVKSQRGRAQSLAVSGDTSVGCFKSIIIVEKHPATSLHADGDSDEGDDGVESCSSDSSPDDSSSPSPPAACDLALLSFPRVVDTNGLTHAGNVERATTAAVDVSPRVLAPSEYRLLRRASKVLMKSKSFRPKTKSTKQLRDLKAMKTLAGRSLVTGTSAFSNKGKGKRPSVSAQFHFSLQRLMESLNLANPFFIRCIKSNVDKAPCKFDQTIVLRQLRYTGMLATVKIRQSGYNYRLPFEEFIQQYKTLLPRGLLSSRGNIQQFLQTIDLNQGNYQIGKTKVFLRETDMLLLDNMLHQAIMGRIITIQSWMKTRLERKRFLKMKQASLVIQSNVRRYLASRQVDRLRLQIYATILIQRCFRGFVHRRQLRLQREAAQTIQKHFRGYLARRLLPELLLSQEERLKQELQHHTPVHTHRYIGGAYLPHDVDEEDEDDEDDERADRLGLEHSLQRNHSPGRLPIRAARGADRPRAKMDDMHSSSASDEGVLTKESSSEDLLGADKDEPDRRRRGSESSGILDDSEADVAVTPDGSSDTIRSLNASMSSLPTSSMSDELAYNTSTPGSKGPPPFTDIIDYPHLPRVYRQRSHARSTEKSQSVSSLSGAAQQKGPEDLELHLKPALTKSSSEEVLKGYQGSSVKIRLSKRISAPLAHQESFNDSSLEDTLRICVARSDLMGHSKSATAPPCISPPSGARSPDSSSGSKSPFHKAKKHLMRTIITGSRKKKDGYDSDDSQAEDSPTSKTGKLKENSAGDFTLGLKHQQKHNRKASKKRHLVKQDKITTSTSSTWSVSSTSQWQYPADYLVQNTAELRQLSQFVSSKISQLCKDCGKRDTIFDVVFKGSLKAFYSNLLTQVSIALQDSNIKYRYKDLMINFEEVLRSKASAEGTEESGPVTMGINAFRGFLDEFNKKKELKELPEVKVKKEKKKKDSNKDLFLYHGHRFHLGQFNIPTFCELCSSLIWMVEKGYVCQVCKYTVHRKCCTRSSAKCKGTGDIPISSHENQVIGVALSSLLAEDHKVPVLIDKLISAIELNGLYTEGIYRKNGAAPKIKQFIRQVNTDLTIIDFNETHIHVLTSVMKTFFRELPEPLLTYDFYDEFIMATDTTDESERLLALYSVVDKLPQARHDLLERLVFHLAKVAHHEGDNKMSANGLAIIFAPCILRSSRPMTAQKSLDHVPKLTMCVHMIILEQMRRIHHTLEDIKTLDSATASAEDRLSAVRASISSQRSDVPSESTSLPASPTAIVGKGQSEVHLLAEQIRSLQKEKEALTLQLPRLECRNMSSSDEDLLSTEDIDSTMDDQDNHPEYEEYALTFDEPVSPPKLRHLNKHRAQIPPNRRPPSSVHTDEESDVSLVAGFGDIGWDNLPRLTPLEVPKLKQVGDEILV